MPSRAPTVGRRSRTSRTRPVRFTDSVRRFLEVEANGFQRRPLAADAVERAAAFGVARLTDVLNFQELSAPANAQAIADVRTGRH